MVPQMTPMVAAVPKAVPVRTERRQLSRKVMSRKTAGRMALAAKETMTGIVPACRHRAVSRPMRRKLSSTFLAELMPERENRRTSRREWPRRRLYSRKKTNPASMAQRMGRLKRMHSSRAAQNAARVRYSMADLRGNNHLATVYQTDITFTNCVYLFIIQEKPVI